MEEGCFKVVATIGYIGLSTALTTQLYPYIDDITDLDPYFVWLAAVNATTLIVYGLDKLLSILDIPLRAPEIWLHLLSIAGGFLGAWFGIVAFDHKSNLHKHRDFGVVLTLSALVHAWIIWTLLPGSL